MFDNGLRQVDGQSRIVELSIVIQHAAEQTALD